MASPSAAINVYATPRRLGVKIADVLERAPDRAESKKLMPAKVAYGADGKPTAALMKRLEKDGIVSAPDHVGRREVMVEVADLGRFLS